MRIIKLITCLLFTLMPALLFAQNMFSALHLNREHDYKTSRPKKIIENRTFFGPNHNEKQKSVKTFDIAGMLLTEERFDNNGQLIFKSIRTNDTTNRLILSTFSENKTAVGIQKHRVNYIYNNQHFLIQITYKNEKGSLFEHYELINDDHGNPIELTGFDANENLYGKEIATYLYDKNKVVTSVVRSDGTILNTDTSTLDFSKNILFPYEGMIFNSHGDLTNWINTDRRGNKTYYEATLAYDDRGNCINETTYKITIKPNGKRKQEIHSELKKSYVY